jgi:hypothetical protein
MSRIAKAALLLLSLAAICLLALSSSASASTAVGTSGTAITSTGPTTLTFSGVSLICTFSWGISPSRTISKTAGSALYTFTNGSIGGCNPATVTGTINNSVSAGYRTFTGTLPNITGFTASTTGPLSFTLHGTPFPAAGCVFTAATGGLNYTLTGVARSITGYRYTGSFTSTGVGCPTSGSLVSTQTPSGAVALTLI